jgi:hypothetical protein
MAPLGADNATLLVKTYRAGIAAMAGHDLVIVVTRCEANVDLGGRDDRTEH